MTTVAFAFVFAFGFSFVIRVVHILVAIWCFSLKLCGVPIFLGVAAVFESPALPLWTVEA